MVIEQLRLTTPEFLSWTERPENQQRLFELIDGEIVEKVASFTPSRVAMRVGRFIGNYLDEHPTGYVTGADGTYRLDEYNALMPDVGYISKARLPEIPAREVPLPPDLAVEVKSPTDTRRELRRQAEQYMAAGTRMVWLIFPEEGQIEVYLPDQDVIEIELDGVLDGGDVLPGFTLAVSEVFRN